MREPVSDRFGRAAPRGRWAHRAQRASPPPSRAEAVASTPWDALVQTPLTKMQYLKCNREGSSAKASNCVRSWRLHRRPPGQAPEARRLLGARRRPQIPRARRDRSRRLHHRRSARPGFLPVDRRSRFDEVYQLAADMGGAGYIFTGEHDADVMHNSATINLNMLDVCRKRNIKKRLLFLVRLHVSGLQPDRSRQSELLGGRRPIRPRPTANTAGRSCSASASISPTTAITA